jgi:hypothetical protein
VLRYHILSLTFVGSISDDVIRSVFPLVVRLTQSLTEVSSRNLAGGGRGGGECGWHSYCHLLADCI